MFHFVSVVDNAVTVNLSRSRPLNGRLPNLRNHATCSPGPAEIGRPLFFPEPLTASCRAGIQVAKRCFVTLRLLFKPSHFHPPESSPRQFATQRSPWYLQPPWREYSWALDHLQLPPASPDFASRVSDGRIRLSRDIPSLDLGARSKNRPCHSRPTPLRCVLICRVELTLIDPIRSETLFGYRGATMACEWSGRNTQAVKRNPCSSRRAWMTRAKFPN